MVADASMSRLELTSTSIFSITPWDSVDCVNVLVGVAGGCCDPVLLMLARKLLVIGLSKIELELCWQLRMSAVGS
jgi:hypothetical protein